MNVNGGAVAIGHPIGASGARVLVTLIHEMMRREGKGVAVVVLGGGVALAVERSGIGAVDQWGEFLVMALAFGWSAGKIEAEIRGSFA